MPTELNLMNDEIEEIERDEEEQAPPPPETRVIHREIKRILEALLFSASEPLPLAKLREIVSTFKPIRPTILKELLAELREEYLLQERAFQLEEIADGYLLRTKGAYGAYVQQLHFGRRAERLSPAATEVLAIIAYRQPITRPKIEAIRGVDSSGTVYALQERGLVEAVGKLEAPGRPTLYGTTQKFLQHFGLKSLEELPSLNG